MVYDKDIYEKPLPEDVMDDIRETLRLKDIIENCPEEELFPTLVMYGNQVMMMLSSFKIAEHSGLISSGDFDELKSRYYIL